MHADANGYPDVGGDAAPIEQDGRARPCVRSVGILGTCIKEAPEFLTRRTRHARGGTAGESAESR